MKSFKRYILAPGIISAIVLLAGCAASIPGNISTYHQSNLQLAHASFAILPLERIKDIEKTTYKKKRSLFAAFYPNPPYFDVIEYGYYSDLISQKLSEHGMQPTELNASTYTVQLMYGRSGPLYSTICAPVNLQIPSGYGVLYMNNQLIANYYGIYKDTHVLGGFTLPNAARTAEYNACAENSYSKKFKETFYQYYVSINIYKTSELNLKNRLPVYRAFITTRTSTPLTKSQVVPGMIDRIFEKFPSKNIYNQETTSYLA